MNGSIAASSITKNVTLNIEVTGVRTMRVRMWLGVQLLRFAAFVIGCGIRINQ